MAKSKQRQQTKNDYLIYGKQKLSQAVARLKSLPYSDIKTSLLKVWQKTKNFDWRQVISIAKQVWRKARQKLRKLKKPVLKVMKHWRFLTIFLPSFLFFYYLLGSMIVENTDVSAEYKVSADNAPAFATAESMSFLLKREVNDKMWTPNLPLIFPASILDNMPNFQIGVVSGVKEMLPPLLQIKQDGEAKADDIKSAYELLSYPPDVWLMSRQGKFGLAPSSNSQYRKAAAKLHDYAQSGEVSLQAENLRAVISKMSKNLQKLINDNEVQQREKADSWLDISADNKFYFAKGYAYALWQISKTMAIDFKDILLEHNLYTEWTHLVNSLQKAAEFTPRIIRNGKPDSTFTPNHLLVQNFYLQRAIIAAQKIYNGLMKEENAD